MNRIFAIVCIVYVVKYPANSKALPTETIFERVGALEGFYMAASHLVNRSTENLEICAVECVSHKTCLSLFFNENLRHCSLHSAVFKSQDTAVSCPGNVYYAKRAYTTVVSTKTEIKKETIPPPPVMPPVAPPMSKG